MQNRYPFVLVIDVFVSNGILLMRKYGDFCAHPWYFVREKANLKRLDYHFDKRVLCVWLNSLRDTRFYLFYITSAAISGDSSMFPSLRTMMKLASLSAFITLLYVTSPMPLKRLRLCHPFWVVYCRRSRTVLNPISPYKTL